MKTRIALVLVAIVVASMCAVLWVPTDNNRAYDADNRFWAIEMEALEGDVEFAPLWWWRTDANGQSSIWPPEEAGKRRLFGPGRKPYWPLWIAEFLTILLLGGGLLTHVVRRERRKRAT